MKTLKILFFVLIANTVFGQVFSTALNNRPNDHKKYWMQTINTLAKFHIGKTTKQSWLFDRPITDSYVSDGITFYHWDNDYISIIAGVENDTITFLGIMPLNDLAQKDMTEILYSDLWIPKETKYNTNDIFVYDKNYVVSRDRYGYFYISK